VNGLTAYDMISKSILKPTIELCFLCGIIPRDVEQNNRNVISSHSSLSRSRLQEAGPILPCIQKKYHGAAHRPINLNLIELTLDDSIHTLDWAVAQNKAQADSEKMAPEC
jgi:hypothetical protein